MGRLTQTTTVAKRPLVGSTAHLLKSITVATTPSTATIFWTALGGGSVGALLVAGLLLCCFPDNFRGRGRGWEGIGEHGSAEAALASRPKNRTDDRFFSNPTAKPAEPSARPEGSGLPKLATHSKPTLSTGSLLPAGSTLPAGSASQSGPAAHLNALPTAAIDLRAAARLATPAVVHIEARADGNGRETVKALFGNRDTRGLPGGEGSGVVYRADGYVVTNFHVVEATNRITVTTSDRRSYPASLIGGDPKSDLAVLKIEAEGLPYLDPADSDAAVPGEWVLAVGSPLGLTSTVTAGIVSAKGRNLSILQDIDAIESFIQTDAAVNPGNSGGPLVNARGKLLGINTAIASKTGRFQGYSFAIPINLVRRIADDIIQYGSYRRAVLGVDISSLTRTDVQRMGLRGYSEGVLVDAVLPGGSADTAGLRPGDLIVRIDDHKLRDLPEFTERIGRTQPGDELLLTVIRNNESVQLRVVMQAQAGE